MKNLFILSLVLLAFSVKAQKGTTTFSISYGDGKGIYRPILAKAELLGAYQEGPVRTFDVNMVGAISKIASIEIGTSLLNHKYQYTSYDPRTPQITENRSIHTLVFPIKLRFDIFKYLFVSGGFMLHSDIGRQGRNLDLGFSIGAGIQYYFKNKYGIFIYPQRNIHTLTIGLVEEHMGFGLAYRIPNKK